MLSLALCGCSCPGVYIDNGPGRQPFILPAPKEKHTYVEGLTTNDYPTGWGAGLIWVNAIGER